MVRKFRKFRGGRKLALLAFLGVLVACGVAFAFGITHTHVYPQYSRQTDFTVTYTGTHWDGGYAPPSQNSTTSGYVRPPSGAPVGTFLVADGDTVCQSFTINNTGAAYFHSDVFWDEVGNTVVAAYWDRVATVPLWCNGVQDGPDGE